jgi:Kef-type K+ transport system membrane component KefB
MGGALPEAGVTTNQILIGVGLILVLAVGAQVVASRLRIPALIVLLPAGFIAGALTTDVYPGGCWGPRSSRWCPCPWPSFFMTRAWVWTCESSGATSAGW